MKAASLFKDPLRDPLLLKATSSKVFPMLKAACLKAEPLLKAGSEVRILTLIASEVLVSPAIGIVD